MISRKMAEARAGPRPPARCPERPRAGPASLASHSSSGIRLQHGKQAAVTPGAPAQQENPRKSTRSDGYPRRRREVPPRNRHASKGGEATECGDGGPGTMASNDRRGASRRHVRPMCTMTHLRVPPGIVKSTCKTRPRTKSWGGSSTAVATSRALTATTTPRPTGAGPSSLTSPRLRRRKRRARHAIGGPATYQEHRYSARPSRGPHCGGQLRPAPGTPPIRCQSPHGQCAPKSL